jgi:hypothetical protein
MMLWELDGHFVRRTVERHSWPLSTRTARLRLVAIGARSEANSEKDREPDPPHGQLGGGRLAGSLADEDDIQERAVLVEHGTTQPRSTSFPLRPRQAPGRLL